MKYIEKVKKYFVNKKKTCAMKKYLERYIELAQFLMTNGSDVDIHGMIGDLVYRESDTMRQFVVNNLIRHNIHGFTVMMYASIKEDADFLDMLIRHNLGSVNTKDRYGYTALMYACRFNRNEEVVKVLLRNGANVNKRSNKGKTALDFAKENGNDIMLSIINRWILNTSIQLVVEREVADSTREVRFNLD